MLWNKALTHTLDERNPAPPGMYTHQLVQDFFHEQHHPLSIYLLIIDTRLPYNNQQDPFPT